MGWVRAAVIGAVVLAAIWGLVWAYGAWKWQLRTASMIGDLRDTRQTLPDGPYDPAALEGLPPPVQRYFRAALTPGQARVVGVSILHEGSFNMGEDTDTWKPFASRQEVETARPGFIWDGAVYMAPGLPVRVHDAYIAGEGFLVPAILGLFKLTDLHGGGSIAEGEAMRWLAEAAWYPTALLPGQGVTWTAIDDRSALATLTDGEVTVSLTFQFGEDDLIASVRAETRDRTVGGQLVATPWEGTWSDYRREAGMLVPITGEVAWILPEGRKPYWRGRITKLDYRFAN
jgi:hypothetical protein